MGGRSSPSSSTLSSSWTQSSHAWNPLAAAVLATVGVGMLAASASSCSFLVVTPVPPEQYLVMMEQDDRYAGAGVATENETIGFVRTADIGILCPGDDSYYYYEMDGGDTMWIISRAFMYASLAIASAMTATAWAITTVCLPTWTAWKLISALSAISAVIQVPVFLVFETAPCSDFDSLQQCSMSVGSYFLIASMVCSVSVTLVTQCLDPPTWVTALDEWRVDKAATAQTSLANSDENDDSFRTGTGHAPHDDIAGDLDEPIEILETKACCVANGFIDDRRGHSQQRPGHSSSRGGRGGGWWPPRWNNQKKKIKPGKFKSKSSSSPPSYYYPQSDSEGGDAGDGCGSADRMLDSGRKRSSSLDPADVLSTRTNVSWHHPEHSALNIKGIVATPRSPRNSVTSTSHGPRTEQMKQQKQQRSEGQRSAVVSFSIADDKKQSDSHNNNSSRYPSESHKRLIANETSEQYSYSKVKLDEMKVTKVEPIPPTALMLQKQLQEARIAKAAAASSPASPSTPAAMSKTVAVTAEPVVYATPAATDGPGESVVSSDKVPLVARTPPRKQRQTPDKTSPPVTPPSARDDAVVGGEKKTVGDVPKRTRMNHLVRMRSPMAYSLLGDDEIESSPPLEIVTIQHDLDDDEDNNGRRRGKGGRRKRKKRDSSTITKDDDTDVFDNIPDDDDEEDYDYDDDDDCSNDDDDMLDPENEFQANFPVDQQEHDLQELWNAMYNSDRPVPIFVTEKIRVPDPEPGPIQSQKMHSGGDSDPVRVQLAASENEEYPDPEPLLYELMNEHAAVEEKDIPTPEDLHARKEQEFIVAEVQRRMPPRGGSSTSRSRQQRRRKRKQHRGISSLSVTSSPSLLDTAIKEETQTDLEESSVEREQQNSDKGNSFDPYGIGLPRTQSMPNLSTYDLSSHDISADHDSIDDDAASSSLASRHSNFSKQGSVHEEGSVLTSMLYPQADGELMMAHHLVTPVSQGPASPETNLERKISIFRTERELRGGIQSTLSEITDDDAFSPPSTSVREARIQRLQQQKMMTSQHPASRETEGGEGREEQEEGGDANGNHSHVDSGASITSGSSSGLESDTLDLQLIHLLRPDGEEYGQDEGSL